MVLDVGSPDFPIANVTIELNVQTDAFQSDKWYY